MRKKRILPEYEQLNLFEILSDTGNNADKENSNYTVMAAEQSAVYCMDNTKKIVTPAALWMQNMLTGCEYYLILDGHVLALRKTERPLTEIPECEKFRHYLINEQVYDGTFLGYPEAV